MSEIVGYGTLTEENAAQWWHEVYERLIKPHEEDVDRIFGYGAVAVVVDVVEVESAERARVEAGMRNMGWDGDATVFRLSDSTARRIADNCRRMGDSITGAWLLRSTSKGRLFYINSLGGTLLLNYDADEGVWEPEPGSIGTSNLHLN